MTLTFEQRVMKLIVDVAGDKISAYFVLSDVLTLNGVAHETAMTVLRALKADDIPSRMYIATDDRYNIKFFSG